MRKHLVFLFATVLSLTACNTDIQGDEKIQLPKPEITYAMTEDRPTSEIDIYWTVDEELNDYVDYYSVIRTMVRDGVTHTKDMPYARYGVTIAPDFFKDGKTWYKVQDCLLDPDTEYTYCVEVYSFDRKFVSKRVYSDKITLKTSKTVEQVPAYPKNVAVKPAQDKLNALTVTWDAVEGATSYEIYSVNSYYPEDEKQIKRITDTTEAFFTHENLTPEETHCYRIKAVKDGKASVLSAKADGTVPAVENITKDKALMLENEVEYKFYSDADTLWFKCIPQDGMLYFHSDWNDYSGNHCTLSIFTEDGTVVASGIPLYQSKNALGESTLANPLEKNNPLYFSNLLQEYGFFENDVNTTTYYLRISKYQCSNFSICIY